MKELCMLVVVVIVLVQIDAKPEPLTPVMALNVLRKTAELNVLSRGLNGEKKSTGGCPLARYHNSLKQKEKRSGPTTHDLREAIGYLLEAGFSNAEIRSPEILEAFARQTSDICQSGTTNCDDGALYRTADGSCNNLAHPYWGSAGVEQTRLLDASYNISDFDSTRNTSVDGDPLPNPRTISNKVHASKGGERFSSVINAQVFQMGQFLDHDITDTPTQRDVSDCCANADDNANCIPIYVQKDETPRTFFNQGYCMNMQRSNPSGCDTDTRQQKNIITSFIDASNVYGSSDAETDALRDVDENGTLTAKMKVENNRLPLDTDNHHCVLNGSTTDCSKAGDHRANVVPSLTAYHYLFVKEHNRLADLLADEYTDQEELFQETRRLLIGIMQSIIYNEFLPSILSASDIAEYDLASSADYAYDVNVNPTMMNVFGISYRIGHTWIPRRMIIFDSAYATVVGDRTDETFFDLSLYNATTSRRQQTTDGPDGLAIWLTGDACTATDEVSENAVRNNLFQNETAETAFDLMALNIQRGRDHGLPSYTAYRAWCRNETSSSVTTFDQLVEINSTVRAKLASVYSNPNDVDIFTGLMSEEVIDDKLGPTVGCILGEQFHRLKYGDRFWYQNQDGNTATHPFTDGQITAIEDYTFSKLLCNNYGYDDVDFPNAFKFNNGRTACADIDDIDIDQFLTTPPTGNKRGEALNQMLEAKELDVLEELLERMEDGKK